MHIDAAFAHRGYLLNCTPGRASDETWQPYVVVSRSSDGELVASRSFPSNFRFKDEAAAIERARDWAVRWIDTSSMTVQHVIYYTPAHDMTHTAWFVPYAMRVVVRHRGAKRDNRLGSLGFCTRRLFANGTAREAARRGSASRTIHVHIVVATNEVPDMIGSSTTAWKPAFVESQ